MTIDTPSAGGALRGWVTASTVNVAGTVATMSALPLVVFQATRDPAAVSVLAVLEAAPYLLLGLFAGHLADRHPRQRIIVMGLVAAAFVAAAQSLGLLGGPRLWLIYGCALAAAVLYVITDAAVFGFLPEVLPAGQLPRAWGLSTAWMDGCSVAVPPLATTIVALAGGAPVLALDAVSFLFAAGLIARMRPVVVAHAAPDAAAPGAAAPPDPERQDPQRQDRDWRAGLRFIRRHPTLRPLVLSGLFNSAGFGLVTALLVVYAVEGLGLPPIGLQIGGVLAATAVGGVVAGVAFSRIYRPHRVRLLSCTGTAGSALCALALATGRSTPAAMVVLACYGALLSVTITTGIVYRQEEAPDSLRSRVMTVGRMIAWGGQPLGAGVGGLVAHAAGVRTAYLLAAGLFAVASLVAAQARVPQRAPRPASGPDVVTSAGATAASLEDVR